MSSALIVTYLKKSIKKKAAMKKERTFSVRKTGIWDSGVVSAVAYKCWNDSVA